MKDKYFINFINGYFKSLHQFSLPENYHLHTLLVAKEAGYNKFIIIIKGGIDILKSDPNLKVLKEKYDIDVLILDYKNIFNFIFIILKYSFLSFSSQVLFYFNSHEKVTYFGIFFSKISSLGKIKNIFMAHTQPKRGGLGNSNLKQFIQDKILFKFFVDRIRLNNITENNFLINRGIKEKKLFISPLVVDDHIFKKVIDYKDRKDILYFGQLSKKKNVTNIVKALRILLDKYPKYKYIKLNIIGKDNGELDKDIKILNLENNILKHGFISQDEKLNLLLNQSLISINDSEDEGQCLTVYESALAGCTLCLPSIMSFVDVFKDKALFHDVGDYEKLAEDIHFYLENIYNLEEDNKKCIDMIKNEYSQKEIEEKMKKLFIF